MAPKWGFIIYRCDYQSDEAWKDFIAGWTTLVKDDLETNYVDGDRLVQTLEFAIRDDPSILNGTSIEEVQTLHMAWAQSEESVAEQMEIAKLRTHNYLGRFSFFVHVDSAALKSCLEYFALLQNARAALHELSWEEEAARENSYVNLVSIPYPRPINEDDTRQEAELMGWPLEDEVGHCIRAHLPSVLPDMYGWVHEMFDLWARDVSRDPLKIFQP